MLISYTYMNMVEIVDINRYENTLFVEHFIKTVSMECSIDFNELGRILDEQNSDEHVPKAVGKLMATRDISVRKVFC